MHNVRNCIDLKQKTKATCDTTMQGTVQNYLHELTTYRLAVIPQNLESSSSKSTFDYAWQLHPANPTPIEHFHFHCAFCQQSIDANYRNLQVIPETFDAINIHDSWGSICW